MLRVTLQAGKRLTLRLEGKIGGEWAKILEECWRRTRIAANANQIRIDLTSVTFVDDSGRALLQRMATSGTQLVATDPMISMVMGIDGIQIPPHPNG